MPRVSLIASHTYSLEGTWLIACTLAMFLPPLLLSLHNRRWRLSIRGIVLIMVAAALLFTFVAYELRPYLRDSGRNWVRPAPGEWWAVPMLLVLSALATIWSALVLRSLSSEADERAK